MIQAVIFDYGHVLSLPQTESDIAALAGAARIDAASLQRLYWKHRAAFDRNDLDTTAYWNAVARDAGVSFSGDQIDELIHLDCVSWSHTNPAMLDWAGRLQASGRKIAVLSNMPVTLRSYLEGNATWLQRFDHRTYSCEVNMVKPETGIYLHSLRGLGVSGEQALFLDDRAENVDGAKRAGLHAALFVDPQQLQRDIDFGLPGIALP